MPPRAISSAFRRSVRAVAFALALACARDVSADVAAEVGGAGRAQALRTVAEMRRRVDPTAGAVTDTWLALSYRGRPALEVKGREAGTEAPGPVRDLAIVDLGTGRVALFVWFPHASARKAGDPIISLSETATRADALLRSILPGSSLVLEDIQRYRTSGQESVYYEAGYAPQDGEIPYLQAPVRLLFDASTGNLFRFDVDAEWIDPPAVPRARISRQAAERVARAALGSRDLTREFGAGAALGKVAAAELFVARPNEWLGFLEAGSSRQARVAWVVPFSLAAAPAAVTHRLFVDAATGRILGGLP